MDSVMQWIRLPSLPPSLPAPHFPSSCKGLPICIRLNGVKAATERAGSCNGLCGSLGWFLMRTQHIDGGGGINSWRHQWTAWPCRFLRGSRFTSFIVGGLNGQHAGWGSFRVVWRSWVHRRTKYPACALASLIWQISLIASELWGQSPPKKKWC